MNVQQAAPRPSTHDLPPSATAPERRPSPVNLDGKSPDRRAPPPRLASLDAYRGFVMLLMISAGLNIPRVAANFKESGVWQFLAYQTEHAAWRGCTLWDLIQPSFMFIVGVALPYSLAARRAHDPNFWRLFGHALWRAFALILLGIFLASTGRNQTSFTFVIVLTQIGLAYPFLWLLAWGSLRAQLVAVLLILVGYWAFFAASPLPKGADSDPASRAASEQTFFTGFESQWEKNRNAGATVDRWLLNQFPQEQRFINNPGGYVTLNFVPSLATMILGLIAGGILRSDPTGARKLKILLVAGVGLLIAGGVWDASGFGPMVKRIWTPSFAIFSAGWSFLLLAFFYGIMELRGYRRWAFPLIVAGMNSIALYCLSMLMKPWIRDRLKLHFGRDLFSSFGTIYAPMIEMLAILLVLWLVSFWMYRRKLFLRI
jgi:heparan-alpha-glucosaminide N-acetyltransferase